jgi:hypothetical protein
VTDTNSTKDHEVDENPREALTPVDPLTRQKYYGSSNEQLTVEQLQTILSSEQLTPSEKLLAKQCLSLLDQILRTPDETDGDQGLYCEQESAHDPADGPMSAAVCLGCWNKLAQEVIELRKQVGAATICGHPECDNDSVLGECSRSPEESTPDHYRVYPIGSSAGVITQHHCPTCACPDLEAAGFTGHTEVGRKHDSRHDGGAGSNPELSGQRRHTYSNRIVGPRWGEVEFPCGHTVAHEEDCPRCENERLRGELRLAESARDYANDMLDRERQGLPLEPRETIAPLPRIRLKDDIYDDGADHHPPGILAHKGDVLEVRELLSVGAAHPGASPGKAFIVRVGEFEQINAVEPSRNQTTNSSGESSLTATASGDTGGAGLLPAASSPDQLCKRCRHSYAQHTKGAVPDDYCRHCVCPAFVPYSPEKSTASHTTENDFQHWLSYSGVGASSDADLRAAYYAGANMPPAKRFDPESLAAEAEEFLAEHLDLSDAGLQFRRAIQLMRDMLACARGAGPAQEPTAPRWRHDWETLPGPSYRCKRCSTSCLDAHAALLCVVEPEKGSGEYCACLQGVCMGPDHTDKLCKAEKASDDHHCMCGKSELAKSQHGYYCKGCGKDLHPDNYLPENGDGDA